MEMTINVSNGIQDATLISSDQLTSDDLDVYYTDNESYVSGWLMHRVHTLDLNGNSVQAIYAGSAGRRNTLQDYFYMPNGNAWLVTDRMSASAQVLGPAHMSNTAQYGMLYAADWA